MHPDGHSFGVTGQTGQHGAAVFSSRQTRPSSGHTPSIVHSCGGSSLSSPHDANVEITATTSVVGNETTRRRAIRR